VMESWRFCWDLCFVCGVNLKADLNGFKAATEC